MKSIKFLAALAFPAIFAACTNEELVAVQEDVQQGKELIGAELIGSGVSINVTSGLNSRMSGTGDWTIDDKLGLGWIVSGNYGDKQNKLNAPTDPKFYANHMFQKENEEGIFTTKGNMSKGWHFGYFPFTYMAEMPNEMEITVNPTQTEAWETDRFNTHFYVTAREFLALGENINKDTYELENVTFEPTRAFNTIGLTVKPDATFTGNDVLKVLKIKSINLNVGAGIFANKVKFAPQNLASFKYDEEGNYDRDATIKALKESLPNVFTPSASKRTSITTAIGNSEIDLSGNQTLRIHTLPATASINPLNVVFTIEVEGGTFTINLEPGDDVTEAESNNNGTILKLVEAFAAGGAMTKHGGVLFEKNDFSFNLMLTADKFEPNFTEISSEAEWDHAVAVANALGMTNVPFNIVKGADGKNWAFESLDEEGNLISLPSGALTVTGEPMILGAEGTWPTEGITVNTDIIVNADLNVEGNMDVSTGKTITNNATIYVGEVAQISNNTAKSLNNTDGRVIVDFGAYVYPTLNKEGVIAYEVKNAKQETIQNINVLISEHSKGYASVNTLIVSTNLDLNAQASDSDENGRYEDAIPAAYLKNLESITVELVNKGRLTTEGTNKKVKNVVGVSGKTAITNVEVVNEINVLAGEMTATDALFHDKNNIYVAKGAILNIVNSVPESVTVKTINDMILDGTVNMGLDVLYVDVLKVNAGSFINIADGCKVICSEEFVQEGTTSGKVIGEAVKTVTPTEISSIAVDSEGCVLINSVEDLLAFANDPQSFINKSTALVKTVKLTKDLDLGKIDWNPVNLWSSAKFILDGNNKTIKNLNVSGSGYLGFIGQTSNTEITIKNLVFENPFVIGSSSFIGTVVGYDYGKTILKNVDVKGGKVGTSIANKGIRVGGLIGFNPSDGKAFELDGCDVEGVTLSAYHNLGGLVGSSLKVGAVMKNCTSKNNTFFYGANSENSWRAFDCDAFNEGKSTKTNCSESGNVGTKK